MKLPIISGQDLIKFLSKKGFFVIRQRGSHVQLKNDKGVLITVPVHSGKLISIGLMNKILRDVEISREEFINLMR